MNRLYTIRINYRVYNTTDWFEAWFFSSINDACSMKHEPYDGPPMNGIYFINEQ